MSPLLWWTEYVSRPVHSLLGLMSGTSADGIDVAWAQVREAARGPRWRLRGYREYPYPPDLQEEVLRVAEGGSVADVCRLNARLGEAFAQAVLRFLGEEGLSPTQIDLIGLHGQTIHHRPPRGGQEGSSLQVGEATVVAERTGIPVVFNFRNRDMAAGGQGAPLVPYVDYLLFRSARWHRALQNIGGIANVTYLPRRAQREQVLAFDTGPGNMVVDALVALATGGKETFDRDGHWARRGRVREDWLRAWMAHPFITAPPPKSTGREAFGRAFVAREWERARREGIPPEDLIATATAWTAHAIAENYRRFLGPVDEVILSGGGAKNPVLREWLERLLAPARVLTLEALGFPSEAKEALAFAVLAHEFVMGRTAHLPQTTGARHPVVLGCWAPGKAGEGG